ncbi:MAG TPA: metallophosphoesterase family protein [Candidatus Angelobacter sp.]|jgi:putative phosphoesterase
MRIAIIADIHGNLTALDAVLADLRQQKPDVIYHGGDLAFGGCNPSEVIDCIIQEGWKGVLGNTDEMLWDTSARPGLEASAPQLKPLFKVLFDLSGPATKRMIGPSRLAWLRALPTELRFENLALMHASPGNVWRAPMETADDAELESTYKSLGLPLVVYCHIHRPFIRKVGAMTVCNTGSVGSPYDNDSRASYLMIDNGKPATRRVAYDVEKEIERLLASDYPYKEWIAEMRRKGSYVPPPENG